jgi:hypothetical protein
MKIYGFVGVLVFLAWPGPSQATETFCAVTERTADGFVSLRDGPGSQYNSVGQVLPSNLLWVGTEKCRSDFGKQQCDMTERWVFVERVFSTAAVQSSLKGWIKQSLIRQVACTDE